MFYQVGCPWFCVQPENGAETRTVTELVNIVHNDLWNATVIVFNIGSHYTSPEHFQAALDVYEAVFTTVRVQHIMVRSPQATHFASSGGAFDKRVYQANQNNTDCQPRVLQGGAEVYQAVMLREFVLRLANKTTASVHYVDVLELSDFPYMHPQYHEGIAVRDCRHICQTCKLLRTWTSLITTTLAK